MIRHALFVRIEARPGNEQAVEQFLAQGLALASEEATTPIWFALRLAPTTFAVFDAFHDEQGVQNHLNGAIAKALFGPALELLATTPTVERCDVLGLKNLAAA